MDNEQIPSVLACDCGNSTIRIACAEGQEISGAQTFHLGKLSPLAEAIGKLWQDMPSPRAIVAASVNPAALKALEAAASQAVQQDVLVVGRDLPLPMPTALEHPESVGVDRLCCAAAAYDRLSDACVVADFGTAITIDCVDDKGVFMGGAILPGLRTGAAALAQTAAQLPEVELALPDWVYGQNTRQAIIGGLVYGARGALRERIEAYATELGSWPTVLLTGGDAKLVCPNVSEGGIVQAVVEDLPLRGVALAYYKSLLANE